MSTPPDSRAGTPDSMASALEAERVNGSQSAYGVLGKRKRLSDGDDDYEDWGDDDYEDRGDDDSENETALFIPDGRYIAPKYDAEDDLSDENDDLNDSEQELDDTNEPVQVHNELMEAFPKCAIYHQDIGEIQERLLQVPQKVLDVLVHHACDSRHVTAQRLNAQTLLSLPKPKKIRIGLLGDAGAGKSSLLNSVTDLDDLAKSLSGGQSCTCVPTEYQSPFDEQRKDYAASIRYFDIKKTRLVLQEMLSDYNTYTFEFDRHWDEDTRTSYKRAMQNSLKTLLVLFCDLDQFQNANAAKAFLQQSYQEDAFTQTIEMLTESCEQKLKNKIVLNGMYAEFIEASSRSKLREAIDPLLGAKPKDGGVALWPLVHHVVIGVRGSRVLDKVTIVDLPGISDTNSIRVDMTKRYIKSCDSLWLVAPIRRVVDDATVYNLLSKYGRVFKNQVMIVCTHSDEGIDRKLANHLRDEGCDVDFYYQISESWKAKRKEVTQARNRMTVLKNRKKPTKQVLIDIQTAEDHLKVLRQEWLAIDQRRFDFLVRARGALVTTQLQEEMRYHLPEGSTLKVQCVSNLHYAALKGAAKVSGARLDAESTGIAALRSTTLALAAPGLTKAFDAYIDVQMKAFLKTATLWVNSTSVERREELLALVQVPDKRLPKRLSQHHTNFKTVVKDTVGSALSSARDHSQKTALKKLTEKRSKHHSTIRAFIRRYGNHSTRICAKEIWNEAFSQGVVEIVLQSSLNWGTVFRTHLDNTKATIATAYREIIADLSKQPSAAVLPMQKFRDLIETQVAGIENVFSGHDANYEKGLRAIFLDMTQDSLANYFSQTIRPVYEACHRDSGPGVTQRSLDKLHDHLSKTEDQSPFAIVEQKAAKALQKNEKKHTRRINAGLKKIFEQTYAAFDGMIMIDNTKTVEDPKEKKARLDLRNHMDYIQSEYDANKASWEAIKLEDS